MSNQLNLKLKSFTVVDESQGIFTAYANVKWIIDSYRDVTIDGAFKASIQSHKSEGTMPKMLWNHNPDVVIGKWISMEEDENGLLVTGQLAMDIQKGQETYSLLKMGALDALSIGYITVKERFDPVSRLNYLEEVDLYEISVATFPSNKESKVTAIKSEDPENVLLNTIDNEAETTVVEDKDKDEPENPAEPVVNNQEQPDHSIELEQKQAAETLRVKSLVDQILSSFIRK